MELQNNTYEIFSTIKNENEIPLTTTRPQTPLAFLPKPFFLLS